MFLQCHYFSLVLGTNVEVNVVIPTPEGNEQITGEDKTTRYDYENGLPVVYLLHGAYGDNNSWMRFSSVERYAQAHNCIAVMAGVTNSFYQDMVHGPKWFTFMTSELPAYITQLFPASKKREDTYIAGFSMGGYGAWYLALTRPDLYGAAASMSGALDLQGTVDMTSKGPDPSPFAVSDIFEDPEHLSGTDKDLLFLAKKDLAEGKIPRLYQACGDQDFLFDMNRSVQKELTDAGVQTTYHEVEGYGHAWDFWDSEIQRIFDWFFNP